MKLIGSLGLAALVALALPGVAALAHPRLIASTPAAQASVSAPTTVQMRFSERLVAPMTGAEVTRAAMAAMPGMASHPAGKIGGFSARVGDDGKTLTLTRRQPLAAGHYSVAWHAVSVDTHRIAGRFEFTVR